jgi:hypothetical protein
MSNSKISALTFATTVAGSEVLPIVQSSATVKVSIANLTPGLGTITAAKGGTGQTSYAVGDLLYADTTTTLAKLADVATGNALISGGVSTAPSWGKIGLTTHVSGTLGVTNGGTGTATAFTAGSVVYAGASGVYSQDNANLFYNASSGNFGIGTNSPAQKLHVQTTSTSGALQFGGPTYYGTIEHEAAVTGANIYTVASASGGGHIFKRGSTTLTSIDASGNQTISIGNLVIGTSGKGIDFSATPNTGTSELFADYEEGTWTPNQGSGLVVVGAFSSSGTYTKVGRVVTATGILFGATSITVTATSAITSNLPYTSATGNSTGACINAATTSTTIIYVAGATVYSTAATAASTYIFFLITYQV